MPGGVGPSVTIQKVGSESERHSRVKTRVSAGERCGGERKW